MQYVRVGGMCTILSLITWGDVRCANQHLPRTPTEICARVCSVAICGLPHAPSGSVPPQPLNQREAAPTASKQARAAFVWYLGEW